MSGRSVNDAVIRFGGVSLSHNPEKLTVKRKKNVAVDILLSGNIAKEKVFTEGDTIQGRGELFGEHCEEDYKLLARMCRKSTAAVLSVPRLGAFTAVLSQLSLAAEPKENYIAVEFVFTAVRGEYHPKLTKERYYHAKQGDDLWVIAHETRSDISKLAELNPQIRNIRSLEKDSVITLF